MFIYTFLALLLNTIRLTYMLSWHSRYIHKILKINSKKPDNNYDDWHTAALRGHNINIPTEEQLRES